MRSSSIVFSFALWAIPLVYASPAPQAGGGTKACKTEPLTEETWNSLTIDKFLEDWTVNVTTTTTNNVQSLANSFGAPNFFCGLDQFCNAGQPCVPVDPPACIIGLALLEIVSDLYPEPKDNVTPLSKILRAITATVGVVPFSGPLVGGVSKAAFEKYLNYGLTLVKPPTTDKFLSWTNVASSLSGVVEDYQAAVSQSLKKILDTPVADEGGIYDQLEGGRFLGIGQNFSQSELQSQMIDSFKVYSISLALQAQKIFVGRWLTDPSPEAGCTEDESTLCEEGIDGSYTSYLLAQVGGDGNIQPMKDIAKKLVDKYGISKKRFLVDPAKCFDSNDKKQLADNFGDHIPLDPETLCLLNLVVCDFRVGASGAGLLSGGVDACRENGADI